jgi:hypothetical protein
MVPADARGNRGSHSVIGDQVLGRDTAPGTWPGWGVAWACGDRAACVEARGHFNQVKAQAGSWAGAEADGAQFVGVGIDEVAADSVGLGDPSGVDDPPSGRFSSGFEQDFCDTDGQLLDGLLCHNAL